MAGGTLTTTAGLQSLNGLFAIYKKQGPTSADVLNKLKEVLLKGNRAAAAIRPRNNVCCHFLKLIKELFMRFVFRGWC